MKNKAILLSLITVGIVAMYFFLKPTENKKNESMGTQNIQYGNRDEYNKNMGMGREPMNNTAKNCVSDGCLALNDLNYPVGTLKKTQQDALEKALDDEYKAYATYDAVINKFGNTRPFIMIIRAEEQHISSLKSLFDKYGIAIPENKYLGNVLAPNTLSEACSTGVTAEIENAALYKEQLLPNVTDYEDITQVFTNLMNASQSKHLPAFERCSN